MAWTSDGADRRRLLRSGWMWLLCGLIGASAWAASNSEGASDLLPMHKLLRGKAAVQPGTLRESPLVVEPPRGALESGEPAPLFPEVMGPVKAQALPPGLSSLSAQTCGGCHFEVHKEWSNSAHARAWIDPVYQAALKVAGYPNGCIHCHIPLENQQPQKLVGFRFRDPSRPILENNPDWDPTLQQEGVTCAACHVRDGVVYGTRDLQPGAAPHPVRAHPDLQRSELCGSCHQLAFPGAEARPFYDTLGEWARSPAGQRGQTCQSCHMPWQLDPISAGGTPVPRRSHRMPGGEDDDTLRRALTLLVDAGKAVYKPGEVVELQVRLLNTGAGHAVPTTAPFRMLTLRVARLEGEKPAGVVEAPIDRLMSPEPPFREVEDRRLHPGKELLLPYTYQIPYNAEPAVVNFRIEVYYHAMPAEIARSHGLDPALYSRRILAQELAVWVQ